ncbi:MAG TPA: hypothetical protein EYF97_01115 [Gammaproteobacteria bacterium]|nr:hypothetical protein [Gammaproteobacteria bacterium]HIK71853.1 hypothetical protein [Gammaproteobacteria bacterium]
MFFSGEVTNYHYSYVHGALISGLSEANKIKEIYPTPTQ